MAADAGLTVTTDSLIYHPGDKVTFNISLNGGGANLSGDLELKIYPPASTQSAAAFTAQPLATKGIQQAVDFSGEKTVTFEAKLSDLDADGSGGYPVRVSLVRDGKEVLGSNTWLAVADPGGHQPVDLVLVWTVGAPPERNPAGQFENGALVGRCQAGTAAPDSLLQHQALQSQFPRVKTTYAVEPSLLEQLKALAGGFDLRQGGKVTSYPAGSPEATAAAGCLESLRQLAANDANTEIVASPYTFTSLPMLARDGWDDGTGQYALGDDVIDNELGLKATPSGVYAPGLDVTTDSLRYLAVTGGVYTVLSGSMRTGVQGRPGTEGEPSYRLRDIGGERITAFFADDDASQALLGSQPDPNAFFAALANDYRDDSHTRLVIAAAPAPSPAIAAGQRQRVYNAINQESWINPITLGEANAKYKPSTVPSTLLRYNDPVSGYISETYYQRLSDVHEMYEDYRAGVDSEQAELAAATRNLFTAESAYLINRNVSPEDANRGLAFLDTVAGFVQGELGNLSISIKTPLLQGSGDGEALVTIKNGNQYAFTADIAVEGGDVEFPQGGQQRLRLEPGTTELRVPYRSSGWAPLIASIQSRGHILAKDGATIHPVSGRVWIVVIVAAAALLGGLLYIMLVVRRRRA